MSPPSVPSPGTWAEASAIEVVEASPVHARASARPDASWLQGPGLFGGLTGAALARAMALVARGRPLRSMTILYCAPARPAPAELVARVERDGARSTFVSGRVAQDGATQVTALACFAADRATDLDAIDPAPPAEVPDPAAIPPMPYVEGVAPVFTRHLDFRLLTPFLAGAERARFASWLRFRAPGAATMDRPQLVALLDAMPPALFARLTAPRAITSVSFELHLLADVERLAIPADAWLLSEARSGVTRGGFSDEEIRLSWPGAPEPGDRLLAVARQLRAVVR